MKHLLLPESRVSWPGSLRVELAAESGSKVACTHDTETEFFSPLAKIFDFFPFSSAFGFFRRYRRRPSPPISRRERVTGVSRAEAPVRNFRRDARPLAAQNFALSISEIFSRASKKKFRKIFFRRFFHSSRVPCQSRSCPSDSPVTPPAT